MVTPFSVSVVHAAVADVLVHQRQAAQAVDHHSDPFAALQIHVGQHDAENLVHHRVGRFELLALDAGLAVNAHADLHVVGADVEISSPVTGRVDDDRATPIE